MNIVSKLALTYNVVETVASAFPPSNTSPVVTQNNATTFTLQPGTGGGQADLHWETPQGGVTLAASASVTYTLSALTDNLGRSVAGVHLIVFDLRVTSRTAGDSLNVGGAGTHPMVMPWGTGTMPVFDSLALAAVQTDAVAAIASGSADQLKITNAGSHPMTFTLGLVMRSV